MAKAESTDLDAVLRRAIKQSETTLYAVSRDSGIPYAALHRFLAGKTDLKLATANKLARHFKLFLVYTDEPSTKPPKRKGLRP